MEKFETIAKDWLKLQGEVRQECLTYLVNFVNEYGEGEGKKEVVFDDGMIEDECVTIMYNGGSHPEYASNCYSVVYGLLLEEGELYIYIEDDNKYYVENLETHELYDLCDYIQNVYKPFCYKRK